MSRLPKQRGFTADERNDGISISTRCLFQEGDDTVARAPRGSEIGSGPRLAAKQERGRENKPALTGPPSWASREQLRAAATSKKRWPRLARKRPAGRNGRMRRKEKEFLFVFLNKCSNPFEFSLNAVQKPLSTENKMHKHICNRLLKKAYMQQHVSSLMLHFNLTKILFSYIECTHNCISKSICAISK